MTSDNFVTDELCTVGKPG